MYLVLPGTISMINETSDAFSSQWRGRLTNGYTFFIKYHVGLLTMEISSKPSTELDDAVGGNCIYNEKVSDPLDNVMNLSTMFVLFHDVLRPKPAPKRK